MYNSITDFLEAWKTEAATTQRILDAITDEALSQAVSEGHRTLGGLSWHVVITIPEMMSLTGLPLKELLDPETPPPDNVADIQDAYKSVSVALAEQIEKGWDDAALKTVDDMYGEKWERRYTLTALIQHQIHHRGQMSVLMRQAGLRVPSMYGPAREDWATHGMPEPKY